MVRLILVLWSAAVVTDPPTLEQAPMPRPNEVKIEGIDLHRGVVAGITPDSITLQIPRKDALALRVCPELAKGGVWESANSWETYRLGDLRVGDLVSVWCHRIKGNDTVMAVTILRRPGGRVPPAPDENPNLNTKNHEWMNALQDWEEWGIPPPRGYLPKGLSMTQLLPRRPFPLPAVTPFAPILVSPLIPLPGKPVDASLTFVDPPPPVPRPILPPPPETDDLPPKPVVAELKLPTLAQAKDVELINGNLKGAVTMVGDGWFLLGPDGGKLKRFLSAGAKDLWLGDRVEVWYDRFDGENVANKIKIMSRGAPPSAPPAIPLAKD